MRGSQIQVKTRKREQKETKIPKTKEIGQQKKKGCKITPPKGWKAVRT
jgi:hypothetical protein